MKFFDHLAVKAGLSDSATARRVYFALVKVIMEELREQDHVELPDWGEFRIYRRKEHMALNVNTGQIGRLPETKQVRFKPDYKLKAYVKDMQSRLDFLHH